MHPRRGLLKVDSLLQEPRGRVSSVESGLPATPKDLDMRKFDFVRSIVKACIAQARVQETPLLLSEIPGCSMSTSHAQLDSVEKLAIMLSMLERRGSCYIEQAPAERQVNLTASRHQVDITVKFLVDNVTSTQSTSLTSRHYN